MNTSRGERQSLSTLKASYPASRILINGSANLIQHVLRHPREDYTIEYHRSQHDVVYETVRSDLLDLVTRGLMRKRKRGRRWVFTPEPDLERKLKDAD